MPDADPRPSLPRDRAFWGMTITQFLGSFNDNVFKQLVLLLCVDYARESQSIALALFAIPFVMFSGFAGWLSDRVSKRRIFVLSKAGEVGVMALGACAFLIGGDNQLLLLGLLFFVLFCMSTQSAFFGPAKYGILPELFRERDLPTANGLVLMTTFVAIIFGMSFGGFAKDWFEGRLYVVSLICVGIGVVGTIAAFLVRITPVAHPGLPFEKSALILVPKTRRMLRDDKPLLRVLIISSLFWFVGGVVQPAVNGFGKDQMHFGDSRTSVAAACLGIGIAVGCILAGKLSRGAVDFRLSKLGAWGCAGSLLSLSIAGLVFEAAAKPPELEAIVDTLATRLPGELSVRLALLGLGVFAGLFVVPLQVFLQSRPPEDQKGRMIGAMNLFNWIGIVLAAVFYIVAEVICSSLGIRQSWIFAMLAVVMALVAAVYLPRINREEGVDNIA